MITKKSSNSSKNKTVLAWVFFALFIIITIFLIVNAALPGEASSKVSGGVSEVVSDVTKQENDDSLQNFVRKSIGHFGLFFFNGGCLTTFLYLISENTKISKWWTILLISFGFGVFLATLTELIQYFTPGRTFACSDILIDSCGYLLCLLIIQLIFYILSKKGKYTIYSE